MLALAAGAVIRREASSWYERHISLPSTLIMSHPSPSHSHSHVHTRCPSFHPAFCLSLYHHPAPNSPPPLLTLRNLNYLPPPVSPPPPTPSLLQPENIQLIHRSWGKELQVDHHPPHHYYKHNYQFIFQYTTIRQRQQSNSRHVLLHRRKLQSVRS